MIPQTPDEMYTMLFKLLMTRAYGDITEAARRGRLTEHDIATIERRILAFRDDLKGVGVEFQTFEAEPEIAKAFNEAKDFFAVIRAARVQKIQKR